MIVNEDLITSSGKFVLLDKMLAKLGQTNHKVRFELMRRKLCRAIPVGLKYETRNNFFY